MRTLIIIIIIYIININNNINRSVINIKIICNKDSVYIYIVNNLYKNSGEYTKKSHKVWFSRHADFYTLARIHTHIHIYASSYIQLVVLFRFVHLLRSYSHSHTRFRIRTFLSILPRITLSPDSFANHRTKASLTLANLSFASLPCSPSSAKAI